MTLPLLESADKQELRGILAAAALASEPDPGVGSRAGVVDKYAKEATELLSGIRAHLKIDPDDQSPQARVAVDEFLSKALTRSLLEGVDKSEVLARVGQAGQLDPSLYEVVETQPFAKTFHPLGVSSNHVRDAIQAPDMFQHLLTEQALESDQTRISLFLKFVASRQPRRGHWFLIQCHRIGTSQVVQSAWKVYLDDVDLTEAIEPLDVLEAFVKAYGLPILIGDKKALFVYRKTFAINETVKVDWSAAFGKHHFTSFSQVANPELNVVNVGVAYCIDLEKYRQALIDHGTRVPEFPDIKTARTTTNISANA
jgi:hypothetical protein